eukprot:TRINITY_DN12097_c0_g1_i1.p1 TRINITY_DN12097_c0_g1~~TRINITY_DN12097_c0_g1_i1.p1  ORF type:complete len:186 (+),score=73.99 TRINITY_DN12097_c0_g1_i1:125-682(+)
MMGSDGSGASVEPSGMSLQQKREDELLHLKSVAHQTEDRIQALKEAQREITAQLPEGERPQGIPNTGQDTRKHDLNAKCAQVDAMLKLVSKKGKRLRDETQALDELKQDLLEREKTCLQFEQAVKDQEGKLEAINDVVARQEQTLCLLQTQTGGPESAPSTLSDASLEEPELVVTIRHNLICNVL